MFYPFVIEQGDLKQKLISQKIYVPTLWRNVYQTTNAGSMEQYFADHLCALPIDQRYDLDDMKYIVKLINKAIFSNADNQKKSEYSEINLF
jgi:dTDP-4-amino-4,6-dideoxygalactose transaminase